MQEKFLAQKFLTIMKYSLFTTTHQLQLGIHNHVHMRAVFYSNNILQSNRVYGSTLIYYFKGHITWQSHIKMKKNYHHSFSNFVLLLFVKNFFQAFWLDNFVSGFKILKNGET